MSDLRDSAIILVGIASMAGFAGADFVGAAVSAGSTALEFYKRSKPKPKFEARVRSELERELDRLRTHGPADAAILLPQMLDEALISPSDVIGSQWDAKIVASKMRAKVTAVSKENEHKTISILDAFENWVFIGLNSVLSDPEFVAEQSPLLVREQLSAQRLLQQTTQAAFDQQREELADIKATLNLIVENSKSTNDSNADTGVLSIDELEALAARFGEAPTGEKAALAAHLEKVADEYIRFKSLIEVIDERTRGLSELKVAAREAADQFDFDEVEVLLGRADSIETEIASQTKELRADNALLRGRVEEAYDLLSAAAASFESIDKLEPVWRKWRYGERFFRYGEKFGGTAFDAQRRLLTSALGSFDEAQNPILFAECNFALALSLKEEARRLGGKRSVEFIEQSISHCEVALRVFRSEGSNSDLVRALDLLGSAKTIRASGLNGPEREREFKEAINVYREALDGDTDRKSRAQTQGNLGGALGEYGYPKSNPEAEHIFVEAVDFLEQASKVFSELGDLKARGKAQINLGRIHQSRSDRVTGAEALALLDRAERAYREALSSFSEDENPILWAAIQFNLGIVFHRKTEQMNNAEIADVFAQGEAAYRTALRIRLERGMEAPVAKTRFHIGALLSERARRSRGEDRERLCEAALNECREALRFYSKPKDPVMWAETQENIAVTLDRWTSNSGCPDLSTKLRDGLKAINAALEIYDPKNMPEHFREVTETKNRLEAKLARLDGGSDKGG